jgi:hypothetical protein
MKALIDREVSRGDIIFEPPQLGCVLSLSGLPGGGGKTYDRSPYGNTGTITGAIWRQLPSGLWYLDFDGVDDKITIPNRSSLNITEAITLETWCYPVTSTEPYDSFIIGSAGRYYTLRTVQSGAMVFQPYICMDDDNWRTPGYYNYTVGRWYHVATTYDKHRGPNNFVLYVDGRNKAQATYATGIKPSTADVVIGCTTAGNGEFGCLALIRIYNRALSALEIQNHFYQEKNLFGV